MGTFLQTYGSWIVLGLLVLLMFRMHGMHGMHGTGSTHDMHGDADRRENTVGDSETPRDMRAHAEGAAQPDSTQPHAVEGSLAPIAQIRDDSALPAARELPVADTAASSIGKHHRVGC